MPHTKNPLARLIAGFEAFRHTYIEGRSGLFDDLVRKGQSPEVLVIACSDSRVDPAIVTQGEPGELFVVRNVAAIVPPCEDDGHYHGTSAALEFGVRGLEVKHVVVLGHALCGGIQVLDRLVCGHDHAPAEQTFLSTWMQVVAPAGALVAERLKHAAPERVRSALEQAAIVQSLANLLSFPWVRERVADGRLALHGWYFDLPAGQLMAYDPTTGRFVTATAEATAEPIIPAEDAFAVARFVAALSIEPEPVDEIPA